MLVHLNNFHYFSMRDIGVILLCVVATTLSLPDPQTLRPALPPVAVRRPAPRPVGGVLRPAPRPVGGVLRPAPPLAGGLLGSLIGIGLLNELLSRSDITTADLERSNEQGLGRILVRRPVYNRVRVVRRRPGLLGGLFGNLLGLGLGAGLVGSLLGRSDLPAVDLEGAYSEDLVDAIIASEVDAAVLAGEDIDR